MSTLQKAELPIPFHFGNKPHFQSGVVQFKQHPTDFCTSYSFIYSAHVLLLASRRKF